MPASSVATGIRLWHRGGQGVALIPEDHQSMAVELNLCLTSSRHATRVVLLMTKRTHSQGSHRGFHYKKVRELDELEILSAEIGKDYEDADGTLIPITDQDLAALPLPTTKTIEIGEIVAFGHVAWVDPLQMDTAYCRVANGASATSRTCCCARSSSAAGGWAYCATAGPGHAPRRRRGHRHARIASGPTKSAPPMPR